MDEGGARVHLALPEEELTLLVEPSDLGKPLTDLLRRRGHPLNTRCGGRGLCRGCEVVVAGVEFLACELRVHGDLEVEAPQRSLLGYQPQVVGDYKVNVPVAHDPLLPAGRLGLAVDIGTTTIVVQCVDPQTGEVLGRASAFNGQTALGDDVVTRISLCRSDRAMIAELQHAVLLRTVLPLAKDAMQAAGRSMVDVGAYVLAGNTTMLHLAAGVDPSSLGVHPFTPAFLDYRLLSAGSLGLEPAGAEVHFLPGAAAYVGADITAGAFASGLLYDLGPALLVDVGTNGEIVLRTEDGLIGCATAAGPAFEGSGLASGMRAGVGAISHIRLDEAHEPELEIIGGAKPAGICGSAYVDFLAEGVRSGLLNHRGRFAIDHPRLVEHTHGRAYKLATAQGKRDIVVSETDVARLLQSKAAIAAGIETLLARTSVKAYQVQRLHLAGGFGMHLRLESAIGCGLLPGFRVEQIELVGNTSLAGATLSILDKSIIGEIARAGERTDVIELNLDPGFEERFIDALSLG